MPDGKEIAERLARLYSLHAAGVKMDLGAMRGILAGLANPEKTGVFIHVAGTNGKGSVCAMIEAMFRAAGVKTGLYTSPHLVRFNERIRVDGACISDAELAALIPLVERAASKAAAAPGGREPTFFEFTTALAFEFFRRAAPGVVVLETGMGGRLDATNVVMPAISAITGVSLEHMAYLGPDIRHIAAEKCGIIKPGVPVVLGPLDDEAMEVASGVAAAVNSRQAHAAQTVTVRRNGKPEIHGQKLSIQSEERSYGVVRLPLAGAHQAENCAIAVAAFEEACGAMGMAVEARAVKRGLETVFWPARFHVLRENPLLVVDGAHNPDAGRALAATLKEIAGPKIGLVAGLCSDKDARAFFSVFSGVVERCWCVPLKNERGLSAADVAAAASAAGLRVVESSMPAAVGEALDWAGACGGSVCVAGSFYLAGETLETLAGPDVFAPLAAAGSPR